MDSPFSVRSEGVVFLGQFWPFKTLEPVPAGAGCVIFGLPRPSELAKLLAMGPRRVLLVEAQMDLLWAMLSQFNYAELLADPRLELCLASPAELLLKFEVALARFRDLYALIWQESQPATELNEKLQSVFLNLGYRAWRQRLTSAALAPRPGAELRALFRALQPALDLTYQTYPLSCSTGCSDCCRDGVSLLIACYPGEWELLWESLSQWPWSERCALASHLCQWAREALPLLEELWTFFDTQMEYAHTSDFNLRHLALIQSQRNLPCFLLDQKLGRCRVYVGRPLTCRLFGASQYYAAQPYTCERDWEQQERILLQEGDCKPSGQS